MWERVGASGVLKRLIAGDEIGRGVFGKHWPELFFESERDPIAEQESERKSGVGFDARGEQSSGESGAGLGSGGAVKKNVSAIVL